jgi:hypothetical protein
MSVSIPLLYVGSFAVFAAFIVFLVVMFLVWVYKLIVSLVVGG